MKKKSSLNKFFLKFHQIVGGVMQGRCSVDKSIRTKNQFLFNVYVSDTKNAQDIQVSVGYEDITRNSCTL